MRAVLGKGLKSLSGEGKSLCALTWKMGAREVLWCHYWVLEVVGVDAVPPAKLGASLALQNEVMVSCLKTLGLTPHIASQCRLVMTTDQNRTCEGWERIYEVIDSQRKSLVAMI